MTENKRFTIKEIDNFNYGINVTDVIMDDGIELPQSTVCDLLNGLSDENDQLVKEKERYKRLSEIRREEINNRILTIKEFINNCSDNKVRSELKELFYSEVK